MSTFDDGASEVRKSKRNIPFCSRYLNQDNLSYQKRTMSIETSGYLILLEISEESKSKCSEADDGEITVGHPGSRWVSSDAAPNLQTEI